MRTGTINEENTIEELKLCNYVSHIFEIGLVESKTHRGIGVSSDGIAIISYKDRKHLASVEVKTRTTANGVKTGIMRCNV